MIELQPFTEADFPQLISWIDNERLLKEWSGALFSFPLTPEKLTWYIEGANDPHSSDAFVFKAVDTRSGQVVGHISLGSLSPSNQSARITRVLVGNTASRGRGFCAAMMKATLQFGFETLGLHRISLGVYSFNEAAIRCYQRCGLHREGTLRDVVRYGSEYWSLVEMSMLAPEWQKQKAPAPVA
ncbi:GNAT family N-acetyltransferase [Hymenobacter latericus]|uniref:GNAT family N-acetyltransferase n=1 Tax=Hymenobacter sp. YIM 151858-1 TaxID=2987688 RepID=UPI0022265814|nr:GNAT family protein [Hymenobacter sp. YIM 151858-1]UYZ60744.1 GNAT family N-acetyltransferase [Hymenobacter sp. YIM 151858-1]